MNFARSAISTFVHIIYIQAIKNCISYIFINY